MKKPEQIKLLVPRGKFFTIVKEVTGLKHDSLFSDFVFTSIGAVDQLQEKEIYYSLYISKHGGIKYVKTETIYKEGRATEMQKTQLALPFEWIKILKFINTKEAHNA